MTRKSVGNIIGQSAYVDYAHEPDVCPICHHAIVPKTLALAYAGYMPNGFLEIVFQCTKRECQEVFIGKYKLEEGETVYKLFKVTPVEPKPVAFSKDIVDLSPGFKEIYTQAMAADTFNLSQLTGIGLRKALEFLIKDFAISQVPQEEEQIKRAFLGNCIDAYINDPNVKACAKRAAWLGNDETHYVKRWEDKDVNDLKIVIKLTVNWIENVLLTKKYSEGMTEK